MGCFHSVEDSTHTGTSEPPLEDTPSIAVQVGDASETSSRPSSPHDAAEVVQDEYLKREFKASVNRNVSYVFNDIIDDKHNKYMKHYSDSNETLFWGIGIENESYLMLADQCSAPSFPALKHKSERYSVDYFKNFKSKPFQSAWEKACSLPHLTYPIYLNSHTFQKTDPKGNHRTLYDTEGTPNPAFTESIHDHMIRESAAYREVYDQSIVYDGDSIEFITQRFYNGTGADCVQEWKDLKALMLREAAPLYQKWGIGTLMYPDHNYGFVTFLSTRKKNLGICNTGTVHVNLTLPTILKDGCIANKDAFAKTHLNFIEYIQMIEPLVMACYGTPDVLSFLGDGYSLGSLRVSRSRYISLQTFDTAAPINGKLLLMEKPSDPRFWYNQLKNTPYYLNPSIGYDVNFNKFKNHGIELRFFDWFPEDLWPDVLNLFILLAQHSVVRGECRTFDKKRYNGIILACVQKGCTARLSSSECNVILEDLGLEPLNTAVAPLELLQLISDRLYDAHKDGAITQQMSPLMERPRLVDYNRTAFEALWKDLFGRPELIIRAEENPLETRTPLAPSEVAALRDIYCISVESSSARCYSDEEYRNSGANIVTRGYWARTQHSLVIGLKGLSPAVQICPTQTHMYFAHCFKGQEGSDTVLSQLRGSTLIDYEFMTNREGKRVLSFCAQSGKVGAYLALMAYCARKTKSSVIPAFHEDTYQIGIETVLLGIDAPRVLLIGYGTAGKRAKQVLDQFGVETTIWTSQSTPSLSVIREHQILIHAIRLPDDTSKLVKPFLTKDDLSGWRGRGALSVVCDISCDLGNPRNTLPIYDEWTLGEKGDSYVRRLDSGIDLIAIPHLPSLDPEISSSEFSSVLVDYLPSVRWFKWLHGVDETAAAIQRSYNTFLLAQKS